MMSVSATAAMLAASKNKKKTGNAKNSGKPLVKITTGKPLKVLIPKPTVPNTGRHGDDGPKRGDVFTQTDHEYVCDICKARFNRRYNRDRHVELTHKVPRPGKPPLYPTKLPLKRPVDVLTPESVPSPTPVKVSRVESDNGSVHSDNDTNDEEMDDSIPDDTAEHEETTTARVDSPNESEKDCEKENNTDDTISMLQVPMCKEVTVTLYITTK